MQPRPAILLTGAARHSLGSEILEVISKRYPVTPIIIVDKEDCPSTGNPNVRHIRFDLNPFGPTASYKSISEFLQSAIHQHQRDIGFPGLAAAIISAGSYEYGPLGETSMDARQGVIGTNICGHLETTYTVLAVNRTLGFDSSRDLTLVSLGSLHAFDASEFRSIYAASKSFGLALCTALHRGGEVNRAYYVAPGAIDTHMLHRNHWICKEHGSTEFFEILRRGATDTYNDIFEHLDDCAFERAASLTATSLHELRVVFERYKARRNRQFCDENGVLKPAEVANHVAEMIKADSVYQSGVYLLTAPNGKAETQFRAFSVALPHGSGAG